MLKPVFFTLMFIISFTAEAENKSILGLDYFAITENQLLAEILLETEPKLIANYSKIDFGKKKKIQASGMRGLSLALKSDLVLKSWIKFFDEACPEMPLRFLKLNKEKYPNLWNYGDLVRLQIEKEKSKRLYEALHGEEYSE